MPRRNTVNPNLSGRDLQIFQLHCMGWQNNEIAAHLGVTPSTIVNCLNCEPVKAAIEQVWQNSITQLSNGPTRESAVTMARAVSPRMMQLAINIAESGKSEAVRLQAITGILDRSLGKATQRVVVDRMDEILDRMSAAELEIFHKDGTLPAWAEGLNASGESESTLH